MKTGYFLAIAAAAILSLSGTAPSAQTPGDNQAAQIAANVPRARDFERFLMRDLHAYFSAQGIEAWALEYELLRDGPTQSGASWPKYYLWVSATPVRGVRVSGAVRVEAIERQRFEITDFVSREDILADPARLESVFPAALLGPIRSKAAGD